MDMWAGTEGTGVGGGVPGGSSSVPRGCRRGSGGGGGGVGGDVRRGARAPVVDARHPGGAASCGDRRVACGEPARAGPGGGRSVGAGRGGGAGAARACSSAGGPADHYAPVRVLDGLGPPCATTGGATSAEGPAPARGTSDGGRPRYSAAQPPLRERGLS